MSSHDRILDKIQKCMNLSKSDNAAEAAAALRQAQKLMQKHNLDTNDLELNTVSQAKARCATKARNPAPWVLYLRQTVANAFGVDYLSQSQRLGRAYYNHPIFLGVGDKPSVAQYCYEVLYRQVNRDRVAFKKEMGTRLSNVIKTKRSDIFCMHWVHAVKEKVEAVAMTEKDEALVKRYTEKNFPNTGVAKLRPIPDITHAEDVHAIQAGLEAGANAQLFSGVSMKAPAPALS